jgi:acid-sensing ion channel, other
LLFIISFHRFNIGIKYLTDKRLPWSEKLFWAIALILSSIAAGYFIQNTFRQWQQTPVIVTLSENFMNVWEIPHPAFTICPIGGANPLSNVYKNLNVTNKQHVNRSLNYFEDTDSMKITNTLWMSKPYNSSDLFRKIVTEEGYCYSFNSKNYYDLFNHNV